MLPFPHTAAKGKYQRVLPSVCSPACHGERVTQLRSPAMGPVQAQLLAWQLSLPEQLDSCATAASLHRPSTHTGQLLLPALPRRKVLEKGAPSYSPHSQELYSPPSKRQCHFGTNNNPSHSLADTHEPWTTLGSRSW